MYIKKYDINKIYLVDTERGKFPVYPSEDGRYIKFQYKDANAPGNHSIFLQEQVKIIDSLKNLINKYGFQSLLLDTQGKARDRIGEKEIISIFNVINNHLNLDSFSEAKIRYISYCSVNMIADLLGMNTSSGYGRNINETIVQSEKYLLFKSALYGYIKTSLLVEKRLSISNCKDGIDYRILRALIKAGIDINENMKNNTFNVTITTDGNVVLDGMDIQKIESGYQKRFKF